MEWPILDALERPSSERTIKNLAGLVYKLRGLGVKRGDLIAGWASQRKLISVVYLGIHYGVVFYVPLNGKVQKAFSLEDFDPQYVLNSSTVDETVVS